MLEAGEVAAYDDEVQVLVVLARVVEQRPPAGGQDLEVEPGAAGGHLPIGQRQREAVGACGEASDTSGGRRGVVVAVPGRVTVDRALVGSDRLGVDRPDDPARAPRHRERGDEDGDERGHAQGRAHGTHAMA